MVAKDPASRLSSMGEVVRAIDAIIGTDQPVTSSEQQPAPGIVPADPPGQTIAESQPGDTHPVNSEDATRFADSAELALQRLRPRDRPVLPLLAAASGLVIILAALYGFGVFDRDQMDENEPGKPPSAGNFALRFDGAGNYVSATSLIPNASDQVTLEFIGTPLGYRTSNVLSWLGPDWMAVFFSSESWGVSRLVGEDSRLIRSTQPAELDREYHVAATWDGSNLRLFVDGRLAETVPVGFDLTPTDGGLHIGGVPRGLLPPDQNDRFFLGDLRVVRISHGVRYTETFESPEYLTTDSATLALYDFTHAANGTVRDESGNGHDAILHGSTFVESTSGP